LKRLCCLLLASWALPAAAQPGSGPWNAVPLSDLRVGIADVDITPTPGTALAGYSSRGGPSTGVHDRLRATAVVFDDGQARAAIVAVDLLNLRQADGEAIVAAIERAANIPRLHVLLNASHTHAAHSLGKSGQGRAELATKIAGAVARAVRRARPASLGYGEGTIDFNINRRAIGPDGKARAGLNPAGIVDRRVKVLRIDHGDAVSPAGVIVSAVCHPNVLRSQNRQISADFVGLAKTFVERNLGGKTMAMYLQGTTGDIRANLPSLDPADGFGRNGSEADLVWAGHGLGSEVVGVATGLRVREKILQRKQHFSIRAAEDVLQVTPDPTKRPDGGKLALPIRALAVGDFLFVSLPGEPVVEYGLGIEKDLAPLGKTTFVLGYGAGDVGYIPVEHMIDEGGLEAAGPFWHGTEIAIRAGVKTLVLRMLGEQATRAAGR
jgi:neutral ceramidase